MDTILAALTTTSQSVREVPVARHDDCRSVTPLGDARVPLQALLDQLPEGVAIAYGPPDFADMVTNRRLEELLGFRHRDPFGMIAHGDADAWGLFLSDGLTRAHIEHLPLYRASRFGETVRNEEMLVARSDGTRTSVLVDAHPIKTRGGRIAGAIASWRDITNIKQAQHVLQRAEARLREADVRKDEFLGILAHELRGPLSPIHNVAHALRLMAASEDKVQAISDILDRQVAVMARLLDDLLDLSHVTRGKLSLRLEPVELLSAIEQAVEWNQAVIDSKRLSLVVEHPPGAIVVHADPVRLAQVVSNLLGNAAKFTDAGGHIWITVGIAKGEVVVGVRDTGPGLAASDLDNIFDLFYQLDRTADRAGRGLGIGLALVRRLVEMHGGSVKAVSAGRGRGSEFLFRLPLVAAAS